VKFDRLSRYKRKDFYKIKKKYATHHKAGVKPRQQNNSFERIGKNQTWCLTACFICGEQSNVNDHNVSISLLGKTGSLNLNIVVYLSPRH